MTNREIKFRVWNGTEMVYDVTVGKFGVFYVNPSNNGLDPNDSASLTPFTTKYPDGTPVMQYTGLKDKNGVEIFEGDIIRSHQRELASPDCVIAVKYGAGGFVIYNPNCCDICKTSFGCISDIGDWNSEEAYEVIGSIYSNPELLQR